MARSRTAIIGLCGLLVGSLTYAPIAVARIEIIASTRMASPDGNGRFSGLYYAGSLNDAGDVAFVSQLTNSTISNDIGLFRYTSAGLEVLERKGQFLNGRAITHVYPADLSSTGSAANIVEIVKISGGVEPIAVFANGGPIVQLALPGSASPSGNNALSKVLTTVTNDGGTTAYIADYTGANAETGIYSRTPDGTVSTRLLKNAPVPRGGTISGFAYMLAENESAQISHIVDINSTALQSLIRLDGNTIHELVREGDLASDGITTIKQLTSSSTDLTYTPTTLINDHGQIAFTAQYTQPASHFGVFLADDAGARLVAPDSGLPGTSSVATSMIVAGVNNAGRVAFSAEFAGGSDPLSGLYTAGINGQSLIALEDTLTPISGKYFRSFQYSNIAMNEAGQVVFWAELSNTPNGASAGQALFLYDPSAGLKTIIRSGDTLLDGPVTILPLNGTMLDFLSLQSPDTSMSGLNNHGQVAFGFWNQFSEQGIALWSPDIPGDFNEDGIVNGADYVRWRNGLGTTYTESDYATWRSHFGESSGGGHGLGESTVPEPNSVFLTLAAVIAGLYGRRSTGRKFSRIAERTNYSSI